MENKKINYIVFDVNGKVRKSYISNLVATSANQKVFVFNDADIITESTAYRSYARIKRADSFNVGPITLLASEITVDNTGYTLDELNKFLESINVDYTSCRILTLEKQALAVSGPISITVVYDRVNELGRTIETQAKAEVSAYVYNAVEEIFTEEEYNSIKEEMLPRDLGDITLGSEISNNDVFLGKQDGNTKLFTPFRIREYVEKYNVINLGEVAGGEDDFADSIVKRGVYRYEYDDGPFGYAGLLINAFEDGGGRTQMKLERDYVMYRTKPEGTNEFNEWKIFNFDEIHELIEEGIISGTLESFIESKVYDKINEVNPRLATAEIEINTLKNNKADKAALQAVASGSPKGVYNTVQDLQAAFPNGDNHIYVVTADGNWYYWDGSAWTAGGIYQSSGIADNSIDYQKLESELKYRIDTSSKFIKQPLKKINGLSLYDLFELNNEVDIHKLTKHVVESGEINFTLGDDSVEIELFSAGPFASLRQYNFDVLGGTNYFLAGFGKVIEKGLGKSVVGLSSGSDGQLEFTSSEFEIKSMIYNRVDDRTTSFLLSPSLFNGISNGHAIFKNVVFINISALGLDYLTIEEMNKLYEEYVSLKENLDFQFIKDMIGNSPNEENSLVMEKFIYQPLSDLNNHSLYEIFELGKEVEIKNYHSNRYYNSGLGNVNFKENSIFYTRWNNENYKGYLGGISNRIQVSIPPENSNFYMNLEYDNWWSGQYIKQNDTGYIGNASLLVYGPSDDGGGSESIINVGIWDIGQFGLTNISLEDLDYYYNLFIYLKEGNKEFELVERTRKIDSRLKKIEDNVKDDTSTPTSELSFQSINNDFIFIILAQSYDKNVNAVINDNGYKLAQSIDSGLTFDIGATVPGDVEKLIVFSDGVCVFATRSGKIYRALNYQSAPVVVYDGNIGFRSFSVTAYEDETKQYILAGEYAHGIVQKNLYVSKDGGLTFELLKEGDVLGTTNNHWHTAIYDQYSDGVWASQGDDQNKKTYYTENWGLTWETIEEEQPTSIVAFPDRVVFGRDNPRQWPGANQWIRSEERPIKFENSLMFDKNKYRSYEYYPGSTRWVSDNPNEYYLHFPAHALPTHERIYATGDGGKTWHLAFYKDKTIFKISNLSGKDKCGYLFAIKEDTSELVRATPYLWSNNKKDNDRFIPYDWSPQEEV